MCEFIHTFSAKTLLSAKEKDALTSAYRNDIFYISTDNKRFIFCKYAKNGLRINIEYTDPKKKRYDTGHREFEIELIITPAKLLYPNEAIKKLYTIEEYKLAFKKLEEIFEEIRLASGVSLWNETKIQRVDITKDISTESDAYSREVIRLAKLSLHKTGYHLWIPSQEDVDKTGWEEENSTMFFNHNEEILAKLYNKLMDLKDKDYDISDIKGLLRFELTLKRGFLKNHGLIQRGNNHIYELSELFSILLDNAEGIMQKYIAGPMWSGNFLSKKLQKKYIKRYCKTRAAKYKKMMDYCDDCKKGIASCDGKVTDYFAELQLSPLHTSKEFAYIPSFARLLEGSENDKIKKYAEQKTR